ncbi:O-methyltransferase [Colletotrichum sp. SAR 10_77]|nr:O-methyltransferase [Colletotrichum sp. SAR 10_77]
MSRSPGSESEARQLLGLVDLLRESVLTVTQQWEKERNSSVTEDPAQQTVPSPDLFEAQRRIEAIAGTLIALVAEPSHRIQQVMTLAVQARALILATEMKIPDKLTAAGKQGIHVSMLSERTGIESRKLVDNEPLRALVQLASMHSFTSEYLAFQIALGTDKTQFDWFAEKVTVEELERGGRGTGYPGFFSRPEDGNWEGPDSNGLISRPELANFGKAMIGSGSVNSPAHVLDYPWSNLGNGATVVDVGGGEVLHFKC